VPGHGKPETGKSTYFLELLFNIVTGIIVAKIKIKMF
jgi:hypothetical protein